MTRVSKILVYAALVLQLCLVLLPEVGHDDILWGGLGSVAAFTTHNCGAHERHKPIDPNNVCQACFRHANSIASAAPVFAYSTAAISPHYFLRAASPRVRSSDYYTSASKRGPPSQLA